MAKSIIIFRNIDDTPNQSIPLEFSINGVDYSFRLREDRTRSFEIELVRRGITQTFSAIRMASALNSDLNQFNDFIIVANNNTQVTIQSRRDGDVFGFTPSPSFTAQVVNQPESEYPLVISRQYYTVGDDNFNTHYRYAYNTEINTLVNILVNGVSGFAVILEEGKTAFVDLPRDTPVQLTVIDSNFNREVTNLGIIHTLSEEFFSYREARTANGTNLTVFYNNPIVRDYSIDGENFQSSSFFPNLAAGTYTITVRDIYLGVLDVEVIVQDAFLGIESFNISELNSVVFTKDEVVDNCTVFENLENTLSCEEDVNLPKLHIHKFMDCDVIKIQFKSSYRNNAVQIVSDTISSPVTVEQKSNYIGLTASMDAVHTTYGSNKTGIYFTSGNTYNYETGNFESTYLLNGNLPVWGVIGNFIGIDGIFYEITDIIYNEDINVRMLIIDSVVSFTTPVSCVYNLFEEEVYEFVVLASSFLNETFRFNIIAEDNRFTSRSYTSELIEVVESIDSSVHVIARNRTNTDINYQTGISHVVRVPFIKKYEEPIQESQNQKTDNSAYLISSDNYKQTVLELEPVTTNVMYQLNALFSSSELYINNVGYVKNGEFDIEGSLEDTNLYLMTIKLIRTGKMFDAQEFSENGGLDFSGFDIPQLSSGESNFVNSNNGIVNSGGNFITY